MPQANIDQLVGFAKTASDLEARKIKVRYQVSNSVPSGGYFRQTFPKIADDMLDCRDIKMRFNLNITSTDALTCVDSTTVQSIFNRVRILSGSTVLCDINQASLCFQLERLVQSAVHDSPYEKYLIGDESQATRQAYPSSREYICSIAPLRTLLNCGALLPLSRMSDLHVEIWLESSARCLYSASDGSPDYNISDIELLTTYIRSPSLSAHFNGNPLSFHVNDVTHRYANVLNQQSLIRWSSAHTSLNKTITVLRQQSNVAAGDYPGKMSTFYSGANTQSYNAFINNVLYFEEDIDSQPESWQQFRSAFPEVKHSEFFDSDFNTTKNVFALNIQEAPFFHEYITSGVKTSNLNSDIVLRVNFNGTPSTPLQADSFLISDALIYLDTRGDLKVKY